ncbi:MAG: hypothetical protein BWX90_00170 [bacterium ADurb.Bin132]|nr:MAG: hypothetical protein BWX90_00170 [bacterium ADurb.Bin132]
MLDGIIGISDKNMKGTKKVIIGFISHSTKNFQINLILFIYYSLL